jgi:hypothetical protein
VPAASQDGRDVLTASVSHQQACEDDALFKSNFQTLVSNSRARLGTTDLDIPDSHSTRLHGYNLGRVLLGFSGSIDEKTRTKHFPTTLAKIAHSVAVQEPVERPDGAAQLPGISD